jgi:hypothetical protein
MLWLSSPPPPVVTLLTDRFHFASYCSYYVDSQVYFSYLSRKRRDIIKHVTDLHVKRLLFLYDFSQT